MPLTASTMRMELGAAAKDFSLRNVMDDREYSLASFRDSRALVVMFVCNHCPYVRHVRLGIGTLADDYLPQGVAFVAINSNDVDNYPQDGPAHMKTFAAESGWLFPYLLDATQEVAKAYGAACTPDFFVFNSEQRLVYRGQMDDSRPESGKPVTGADLRAVLDATLSGKPVSKEQKPSVGCNIKWKPGNQPAYAE